MQGEIVEWYNAKGEYRLGLFTPKDQIQDLIKQGRITVRMLKPDFTLTINEKGGNILGIVDSKKVKVIGYQD